MVVDENNRTGAHLRAGGPAAVCHDERRAPGGGRHPDRVGDGGCVSRLVVVLASAEHKYAAAVGREDRAEGRVVTRHRVPGEARDVTGFNRRHLVSEEFSGTAPTGTKDESNVVGCDAGAIGNERGGRGGEFVGSHTLRVTASAPLYMLTEVDS